MNTELLVEKYLFIIDEFMKKGKWMHAVKVIKQLISSETEILNGTLHYRLGVCYFHLNSRNKAKKHLKMSVDNSTDHPDAWYYLGVIYEEQNMLVDAIKAYSMALKLNNEPMLEVKFALAKIYYKLGMFENALRFLEEIYEVNQFNLEIIELLGACYAHVKMWMMAYKNLKRAIMLGSKNPEVIYNFCKVLRQLRYYQDLRAFLRFIEEEIDSVLAENIRMEFLF